MRIYKYQLRNLCLNPGIDSIDIPKGSEFLKVSMQDDCITFWYKVNPDEPEKESKKFLVLGTGWEVPEVNLKFIDTVFQGPFVWHVFEVL